MIDTQKLQSLAQHLDFEFNPEGCVVSQNHPFARHDFTAISEVGDRRYAEFRQEHYKRPAYKQNPVSGILEEDLHDYEDPDWYERIDDPDKDHDQTLHGLIEDQEGYVAFYHDRWFDSLYRFRLVNGPNGANNIHQQLGRLVGIDIPKVVPGEPRDNGSQIFTAGQITEAMADMKLLAPNIDQFGLVRHDLGADEGSHGPSWPHTHPAIYRHLSRVAQDVIAEHGDRIHDVVDKQDNRPPEVIEIATALDQLIGRLTPHIASLAVMELRVRDGRYNETPDSDIARGLLDEAFKVATYRQLYTATRLLAVPADFSVSQRSQRGHWVGVQQAVGVVDTRLALHQVQPHPEATDSKTQRTLNILNLLKVKLDKKLARNKDHILDC